MAMACEPRFGQVKSSDDKAGWAQRSDTKRSVARTSVETQGRRREVWQPRGPAMR